MTTWLGRKRALSQRGGTLLEPLIAITILCFGMLGLAHFQLNMLVQSADAKMRLAATTWAEELLAQVHTAPQGNAGCYTKIPPANSCDGLPAAAANVYGDWEAGAVAALGALAGPDKSRIQANAALGPGANQITVSLTWSTKAFNDGGAIAAVTPHTHTVITDVRQ